MTTFNTQDLDLSLAIKFSDEQPFNSVGIVKPVDLPGSDELREYVVIVNEGLTIDDLERDLERDTAEDDGVDSSIIPDRPLNVANRREGSERQTHYWMTFAEAHALRNHPDVLDVELCPDTNSNLNNEPHASMSADFSKTGLFGSSSGTLANYGLKRCSSPTNNYGTGNTVSGTYDYIADGSGVDIIIMDTGLNVNHPEFQDANGNSRVQQIDWYSVAGVAGTMPANFYTDDNGHGTAVASIVAGKTFGWAKNAKIYVMNILGTAGTTIDTLTSFDLMKKFHQNKAIDPNLGFKRPTIVNASWGTVMYMMSSGGSYNPYSGHTIYTGYQIWGGSYRGTTWSGYTLRTDYGMNGASAGTYSNGSDTAAILYKMPGFTSSYDAATVDLIAAGVHFIRSSGNEKVKQEISTGVDYNNYANIITGIANGSPVLAATYYNRPNSPYATESITVGSNDSNVYSSTLEQRAYFSNYGTGVDVYAPGVGIVSAGITAGSTYYANSSYYQTNENGTSFSAPQVAGVLALFLQQNPGATPAVGKQWITTNGQGCVNSVMYDTGLTNDYTSNLSLSGGPNKFLNNPFAASNITLGSNGLQMSNGFVTFSSY